MGRLPVARLPGSDLGAYLREQRVAAQLSLRQLSELAGVSNPYLSQIERGLRRPSAEILNALATGLQVSAESLYVRAGLLDDEAVRAPRSDVVAAIEADPALSPRQRAALVDRYRQMVDPSGSSAGRARTQAAGSADGSTTARPGARRRPTSRSTVTTTPRSTP
ncbi:helix-turn-helix domain-containing protein [Arsenicicoccus dermatophilus]|uniref:helix-turn-helix domain-containing protein n=1 Tax=Arsenicicoccus dermatophilus TaxID=1076331 RepID=UPI001F4CA7A4|nr:helix-turn-helix domain-containing protein [Arsenicicoccus dermatophilus]MCH8611977.1 helix-turn-helix domain-containing protein [Arsenicicoccus dermatophilus]